MNIKYSKEVVHKWKTWFQKLKLKSLRLGIPHKYSDADDNSATLEKVTNTDAFGIVGRYVWYYCGSLLVIWVQISHFVKNKYFWKDCSRTHVSCSGDDHLWDNLNFPLICIIYRCASLTALPLQGQAAHTITPENVLWFLFTNPK